MFVYRKRHASVVCIHLLVQLVIIIVFQRTFFEIWAQSTPTSLPGCKWVQVLTADWHPFATEFSLPTIVPQRKAMPNNQSASINIYHNEWTQYFTTPLSVIKTPPKIFRRPSFCKYCILPSTSKHLVEKVFGLFWTPKNIPETPT